MMTTADAVDKARALLESGATSCAGSSIRSRRPSPDWAASGADPGRPRGSSTKPPSGKRRRRRRGGTRADHAHKYVSGHPGATASEIAKSMGIKPNYVYRVMAELEKDGKVRKQGKGYHAAGG